MGQIDLQGNPVSDNLPAPGKLAVMAATGADMRLLLVILIAMELPISGLMSVAGC